MNEATLKTDHSLWQNEHKLLHITEQYLVLISKCLNSYGYFFSNIQSIYDALRSTKSEFTETRHTDGQLKLNIAEFRKKEEAQDDLTPELKTQIESHLKDVNLLFANIRSLYQTRIEPYMPKIKLAEEQAKQYKSCAEDLSKIETLFQTIEEGCQTANGFYDSITEDGLIVAPSDETKIVQILQNLLKNCEAAKKKYQKLFSQDDEQNSCYKEEFKEQLSKFLPSFTSELDNLQASLLAFGKMADEIQSGIQMTSDL